MKRLKKFDRISLKLDFFIANGSNGSDDETQFNDNASVVSNASSGSFMRDDNGTSGEDTTDELSQVTNNNLAMSLQIMCRNVLLNHRQFKEKKSYAISQINTAAYSVVQ